MTMPRPGAGRVGRAGMSTRDVALVLAMLNVSSLPAIRYWTVGDCNTVWYLGLHRPGRDNTGMAPGPGSGLFAGRKRGYEIRGLGHGFVGKARVSVGPSGHLDPAGAMEQVMVDPMEDAHARCHQWVIAGHSTTAGGDPTGKGRQEGSGGLKGTPQVGGVRPVGKAQGSRNEQAYVNLPLLFLFSYNSLVSSSRASWLEDGSITGTRGK